MRPKRSDCDTQMKFRIPPDLKEAIETSADRNMRTLRGEITWRLSKSFEDHPIPDADSDIGQEV